MRVDVGPLIFPIVLIDEDGDAVAHLGTAFPVAPGGFLTCRHVIDVAAEGTRPAIVDIEAGSRTIAITNLVFHPTLDIAYIPDALQRSKDTFWPFAPDLSLMGAHVFSLGHLEFQKNASYEIHHFGGDVVAAERATRSSAELVLPYAMVEGMSGSPVLLDRNEVCVVGMGHGSQSRRVLAAEVVEYEDDKLRLRETVNRIVEFGLAWHGAVLRRFLDEVGVDYRIAG